MRALSCHCCCGPIGDDQNSKAVFCCDECRTATREETIARRRANPSRICRICGEPIPNTRRLDAVYCSDSCGNRNRNRTYDDKQSSSGIKHQRQRAYRRLHPSRALLAAVKHRAKKNNIEFSITEEDIPIPNVCPVLGIPLIPPGSRVNGSGYHPDNASVDRIDPSKGYVPGNVKVISHKANLLKNCATISDVEKVLAYMKEVGCP